MSSDYWGRKRSSYVFSQILVVVLVVASSLMIHNLVENDQELRAENSLREIGNQTAAALSIALQNDLNALESIVAFYNSSDYVSRDEFRTFVTQKLRSAVGLRALEWIPRVTAADRDAMEKAARQDGFADFSFREVRDGRMVAAGSRAEYFPVYYVEPYRGNERALGFDLASNSVRKAALGRARDTGRPIASARMSLIQGSDRRNATLMIAPIFRTMDLPATRKAREEALSGFALGVIHIGHLVESVITSAIQDRGFSVILFDLSDTSNFHPLHAVNAGEPSEWPTAADVDGAPRFVRETTFGERRWRLVVRPAGGRLVIEQAWLPWSASGATFAILLLIALFARPTVRRRAYAEELVAERTRDLETASEKLAESGYRHRALIENMSDGLITINTSGIIQSVNPAVTRIFGYSEAELKGRNVSVLVAHPHRSVHDQYIRNYLETGVRKIIGLGREIEGVRRDGVLIPLELRVEEFHLQGERMFLGVLRDISGSKEAERLKTEFVSTVSHELRTPLTSIRGALGIVESGVITDAEKTAELVSLALDNTERLINLVNDLLDVEKLQTGKMRFEFVDLEIGWLVDKALDINGPFAEEHGVRFAFLKGDDPVQTVADPDRLMQVLSNLLSNAAKYSPPESVVTIEVSTTDNRIRVSVSDRGPGVPEEFRERIFERFTQAQSSDSRAKGGTGLGLNISKAIIDKHGGVIGFEPNDGGGTTFYFELPVGPAR